MRGRLLIVGVIIGAVACGDPNTEDTRGYTKAPLENPGLLVAGEPASPMARVLQPNRPRVIERTAPAGGAGEGDGEAGAGEAEEVTLAPGVTQEQFDEGEQLFGGGGGCQACHGPGGSGSGLGPNLADDEWLHVSGPEVDALAELISTGVADPVEFPAPMPPMGGASLTPDQVRALAGYVASLSQGSQG